MYTENTLLILISISSILHSQFCTGFPVEIDINDPKIIDYVKNILDSMNTEYKLMRIIEGNSLDLGSNDYQYFVKLALTAVKPINQDQTCDLKFIKRHSTPPRVYEIKSFVCASNAHA